MAAASVSCRPGSLCRRTHLWIVITSFNRVSRHPFTVSPLIFYMISFSLSWTIFKMSVSPWIWFVLSVGSVLAFLRHHQSPFSNSLHALDSVLTQAQRLSLLLDKMEPLLMAALVIISTLAAYTCYFLLRLFVLVLLIIIGECVPLRLIPGLFRFPQDPHGALLLPKPPEVDWAWFTAWFTKIWRRLSSEKSPTQIPNTPLTSRRDAKRAMKNRRKVNSAWSTTKTTSAWIWNKAYRMWSATTEPLSQWYAAISDNLEARKRKEDELADARAFVGRKLWPFIQEASSEQIGHCLFCTEAIFHLDMIIALPCKKRFHVRCTQNLQATHHSCPVCCEHRLVTNEAPVQIQVENAESKKEKKKWEKLNRKKMHRHDRKPFRANIARGRGIVKWLSQVEG